MKNQKRVKYNPIINMRAHKLLKSFLHVLQITNKEFAIKAGIPPSTFQSMINNESTIKLQSFAKILSTMKKYAKSIPDTLSEERSYYISSCVDEFQDIYLMRLEDERKHNQNLFVDKNSIENLHIAELNLSDEQIKKLIGVFGDDGELVYPDGVLEKKLLLFFHDLNEEGQKVAVDQIELLTQIPKYQNKKIPPENGQDDN